MMNPTVHACMLMHNLADFKSNMFVQRGLVDEHKELVEGIDTTSASRHMTHGTLHVAHGTHFLFS
jgi:hypothetical protein